MVALRTGGLSKEYDGTAVVDAIDHGRAGALGLRVPRPERSRQDDDHEDGAGPDSAELRIGFAVWAIVTFGAHQLTEAILSATVAVTTIVLLWIDKANAFFATNSP